ncbi:MAG: cyclic nucleotide-binding domain-containing protein [Verrucomicrobia bacterium]|nr:cyclic nucleotide-binding domain-containing protein [Verrucomicrobiota bacterium]
MNSSLYAAPLSETGAPPEPAAVAPVPSAIPPPFRVAKIDQATLLSVIELQVADGCRIAQVTPELWVAKQQQTRTYLTVTPAQWRALRAFGDGPGRTASQVLFRLITDRDCLPLREFYELVVKAYARGFLYSEGSSAGRPVVPARWPWLIDGRHVRTGAVAIILAALLATIVRPLQLPGNVLELLGGWLLACLTTSAGYWLGGCVARRANTEVYHARFHWKTLLPHFRADLDDAIMGGSATVVDVALARLAPSFLALALTTLFLPGLGLAMFVNALAQLSPFWWSPGLTVIHTLYGTRRNDTTWRFAFEPNQAIWYAFTTRLKKTNFRFTGIHSLYAATWLTLALVAAALLLRANAADLWASYLAAGGLHFTALALLCLLVLAVLAVVGTFAVVGLLAWVEWNEKRKARALRPRGGSATEGAIAEALGQALLFQHLSDNDRANIAHAMVPEDIAPGTLIIREGDSGDKLYLLFSGEVEVVRTLDNGREERVATLVPGDVFGEIALLNRSPRTRTVRALSPTTVLSLTREAFQSLVLTRISREQIENTVQKMAFLQRIPLACDWSPHAMAAFSRRAAFQDFAEGSYILHEGEDNQFFYLIYEGELAVRRLRQDIALLHIGEFFGEISLLQNSVTKATIVARTPARCLIVNKREFLQFLTKDFVIGLQFEAISSKRLGQPIFPLNGKSFDVFRD